MAAVNRSNKKTMCKFCDSDITSKHFARHLERNHGKEPEVRKIFSFKVQSTERKQLLALIRNDGNLESAARGFLIPKRRHPSGTADERMFAICTYCKAYYMRYNLSRHTKTCFVKKSLETPEEKPTRRVLSQSMVFSACNKKYGSLLNKLAVKTQIFSKMQSDDITSVALQDPIILIFGEDLLKKSKNKQSMYHISNKLRECGKFLIEMKKLGSYSGILSTLKPQCFDDAIEATKQMSKFDAQSKTFGAATLALHFGTTLKKTCKFKRKANSAKKSSHISR